MKTLDKLFCGVVGTVSTIYLIVLFNPIKYPFIVNSITDELFIYLHSFPYNHLMFIFVTIAMINMYRDETQGKNKAHTELN